MDLMQLGIVCAVSFVGGLVTGITGFGSGIIFQAVWALLGGDLRLPRAIITCNYFSVNIPLAVLKESRKRCMWVIVLGLLPVQIIVDFFATWLLVTIDSSIAKLILGFVFVTVVIAQIAKDIHNYRLEQDAQRKIGLFQVKHLEYAEKPADLDPKNQKSRRGSEDTDIDFDYFVPSLVFSNASINDASSTFSDGTKSLFLQSTTNTVTTAVFDCLQIFTTPLFYKALVFGAFTGLIRGLFAAGGAPIIIFFLIVGNLTKQEIRSTSVTMQSIANFFSFGTGIYHGVFRLEEYHLYISAPIAAAIGVYIGNVVYRFAKLNVLKVLMSLLMLIAALGLIGATHDTIYGHVMKGVLGLLFLVSGFVAYWTR